MERFPDKDGNGIIFAPICRPDGVPKCFTSGNIKQCDHNVTTVKLDHVGDYVSFPSRFMHRGYYQIASNMTYYTLQLFCKMLESPDAFQNVTRGFNKNLEHGRLIESRLSQLTQDIRDNWDTTYSVNQFPPAREFDGKKVDAAKNRHILRVMFVDVPLIVELVQYFEYKYTKLEVQSVWMMEKSRENDGFQGWHRDFYLGTEVTTTIVVNVGALTK
jgi:hypothetical protein